MKMKLGLEEDTNLEVPEDVAGDDTEINESIEESSDIVDAHVADASSAEEVIDNLINIRNHIKKFGITKEFIHLVNTDNQLGIALGITLPCYESDEVGDGDDVTVPETDVDVTSIDAEEVTMKIEEEVEKTRGKFMTIIDNILNAISDFFSNIMNGLIFLRKQQKAATKKIGKLKADDEIYTKLELKTLKLSRLIEVGDIINDGLDKMKNYKPDMDINEAELMKFYMSLKDALPYVGFEISGGGIIVSKDKIKALDDEKTKKSLSDLGYTAAGIKSAEQHFTKYLTTLEASNNFIRERKNDKAKLLTEMKKEGKAFDIRAYMRIVFIGLIAVWKQLVKRLVGFCGIYYKIVNKLPVEA